MVKKERKLLGSKKMERTEISIKLWKIMLLLFFSNSLNDRVF